MAAFFKKIVRRTPNFLGQWVGDNSSRLYGILLPMLRDTRSEQSERTTSTSPFVSLDGRLIDHEEERIVRLD
jgi:hypothetical protein